MLLAWEERTSRRAQGWAGEMADALLEPFHSVLHLTVRKLEEGARLSELLVHMGPLFSVALTHMQLQPFGNQLKLVS